MLHELAPFFRAGKPVEITAADYAVRMGVTIHQARGAITRLRNLRLVTRREAQCQPVFILTRALK